MYKYFLIKTVAKMIKSFTDWEQANTYGQNILTVTLHNAHSIVLLTKFRNFGVFLMSKQNQTT